MKIRDSRQLTRVQPVNASKGLDRALMRLDCLHSVEIAHVGADHQRVSSMKRD